MFAPVGLLKSVTCPFFNDGKCDRPHCVLAHGILPMFSARVPSPNLPSAYDSLPQKSATEEYDPAINFNVGLLSSSPASVSSYPVVVKKKDFVNLMLSNAANSGAPQSKDRVNPSNQNSARKEVKKSFESEKTEKRSSKAVLPEVIASKRSKDDNHSKTSKSCEKSSNNVGLSATQILDDLNTFDEKISTFMVNDDPKSKHNLSSLVPKKPQIAAVIDLTTDDELLSRNTGVHLTPSDLVEAAEKRCQRKLLSPAEVAMGRFREGERSAVKVSNGSSSSSLANFRPHTSSEGTRVAHAVRAVNPSSVRNRPRIAIEYNAKVPTSIRQTFLDKLFDELFKSGKGDTEWCSSEALRLEKEAYGRSSNDKVYRQVIPNVMAKVRREFGSSSVVSPTKPSAIVSHTQMLLPAGAHTVGVPQSKPGKIISPGKPIASSCGLSKAQLYRLMSKYIMTEEQLKSNGYPVIIKQGDGSERVSIKPPDKRITQRQNYLTVAQIEAGERECIRCQKRFRIDPQTGLFLRKEECQYHPGRVQKTRTHARHIEQVYSCCQASLSSIVGCQVCSSHVHEHNRSTDLEGFVQTKDDPNNNNPGIYALDCEMVYTVKGVELARVTVIDHNLKQVFDALVRPTTEVLDYNTEFSGLKACDFENVTDRISDIQKKLCKFFTAKSILVGHSLESDLIALKILHRNVVDTAIVFPHPQGPPFKRALRTLVCDILRKAIQQDLGGHDSFEDAGAAMELMLHKANSDYQSSQSISTSAVADRASAHRRNSNF